MGSQLRWLERTPDKREVDGSIPFEPTMTLICQQHIEKYIDKYQKGKLAYVKYVTIEPKELLNTKVVNNEKMDKSIIKKFIIG